MKIKLLLSLSFLAFIIGCVSMGTNINDPKWLDARLKMRQNEFHTNLLANKSDELWNIHSTAFKAKFSKSDYIEYLKSKSYLAGYYKVENSVENIEITGKKAKVTIKHIEQYQKESPVTELILYYYWVFEGSDWYLLEGGITVSSRADWQ